MYGIIASKHGAQGRTFAGPITIIIRFSIALIAFPVALGDRGLVRCPAARVIKMVGWWPQCSLVRLVDGQVMRPGKDSSCNGKADAEQDEPAERRLSGL